MQNRAERPEALKLKPCYPIRGSETEAECQYSYGLDDLSYRRSNRRCFRTFRTGVYAVELFRAALYW